MSEYDEMMKADKNARHNMKCYHYYEQTLECCATCSHSRQASIEDPRLCVIINPDSRYSVGEVGSLGICDLYKK